MSRLTFRKLKAPRLPMQSDTAAVYPFSAILVGEKFYYRSKLYEKNGLHSAYFKSGVEWTEFADDTEVLLSAPREDSKPTIVPHTTPLVEYRTIATGNYFLYESDRYRRMGGAFSRRLSDGRWSEMPADRLVILIRTSR